jgi:hypothetical protein
MTMPLIPKKPKDLARDLKPRVHHGSPRDATLVSVPAPQRHDPPQMRAATTGATRGELRFLRDQGSLPEDLPGSSIQDIKAEGLKALGLELMFAGVGLLGSRLAGPALRALRSSRGGKAAATKTAENVAEHLTWPNRPVGTAEREAARDQSLIDMFVRDNLDNVRTDYRPPRVSEPVHLEPGIGHFRTNIEPPISPTLQRLADDLNGYIPRGMPADPLSEVGMQYKLPMTTQEAKAYRKAGAEGNLFEPGFRADVVGGTKEGTLYDVFDNVVFPTQDTAEFANTIAKLFGLDPDIVRRLPRYGGGS